MRTISSSKQFLVTTASSYGGIELDSSLNLVIGLFRVSCWLESIEMY